MINVFPKCVCLGKSPKVNFLSLSKKKGTYNVLYSCCEHTSVQNLFKHHPTIYWNQNTIFNYSLVNPILGVQFKLKVKDEVLNLKDFLPDSKIQSSKWMVMVNLNASLYHSTTCIDNSLQRNEYQEVLRVRRVFYSNKRFEKRLNSTRGSDLKKL